MKPSCEYDLVVTGSGPAGEKGSAQAALLPRLISGDVSAKAEGWIRSSRPCYAYTMSALYSPNDPKNGITTSQAVARCAILPRAGNTVAVE